MEKIEEISGQKTNISIPKIDDDFQNKFNINTSLTKNKNRFE